MRRASAAGALRVCAALPLALSAALAGAAGAGCSRDHVTALRLIVSFDSALGIDQLEVALDGATWRVPDTPEVLASGRRVVVLLDDDRAGITLAVGVSGLVAGAAVASGSADAVPVLDETVDVPIALGDGPGDGGGDAGDGGGSDAAPPACAPGAPDGTPCDDGQFCTVGDACQGGVCGGTPFDCSALDDDCAVGVCDETALGCVTQPRPDGTACADGAFCTDPDYCTGGACGGGVRDCSMGGSICATGGCDEAADQCTGLPLPDGSACTDGLFCTTGESCQVGACTGGTARDCSGVSDQCNAGACDEAADLCVAAALPSGTPCVDGLFCTDPDVCGGGACTGSARDCSPAAGSCEMPSCNEAAAACAASPLPDGSACADPWSCTAGDTCTGGMCRGGTDEALCAGPLICNPTAYPPAGSGCGAAPDGLSVSCPATGGVGAAATCTIDLTDGAAGVPGEATRIACSAFPGPVLLFSDDFDDGSLDPPWVGVSSPMLASDVAGDWSLVTDGFWEAQVTFAVTGLYVLCVDFDLAQDNASGGERIRWDIAFDAGPFTTIFDLDFGSWTNSGVTFAYNRNVCTAVAPGAATATWRLRPEGSGADPLWVDDTIFTGLGAPYFVPPNGGPDDLSSAAAWTFAGGTSPYLGTWGGSSAMFAQSETYSAERLAIDATACDVLDVDFDFGIESPNTGELIELLARVDPGADTSIESFDFLTWDNNLVWLPWFGLRRITDRIPAARGASSVVFTFDLAAGGCCDDVWVDNFVVNCADLPDPTVTAPVDAGGGAYTIGVTATAPEQVTVVCTWQTTNDGPLTASSTFQVLP